MSKSPTQLKIVKSLLNEQDFVSKEKKKENGFSFYEFYCENDFENMVVHSNFEPNSNIVNNILNYSKALKVHPSKTGEHFFLMLN